MIKRQDKVARVFIIALFIITIVAAGICAMMPFKNAYIPKDEIKLTGNTSKPNEINVAGNIDNITDFKLTEVTLTIATYDENGSYIKDETVVLKVDLESKEQIEFDHTFKATSRDVVKKAKVVDIEYTYDKFAWYLVAFPGLALIFLIKQFFANRKYYFDVEDSKVVIFASWKKAGVIVDGVLIKEGKLPTFKAEVAQFNMKVAGHKLKLYTLNGDIIPSIRALIDNQEVKYTKVRQNIFVKMMDEGVVRASGDIQMKSKYETDGEEADKYNEERFKQKEQELNKSKSNTENLKACPYCNTMNKSTNTKCSGCSANLK